PALRDFVRQAPELITGLVERVEDQGENRETVGFEKRSIALGGLVSLFNARLVHGQVCPVSLQDNQVIETLFLVEQDFSLLADLRLIDGLGASHRREVSPKFLDLLADALEQARELLGVGPQGNDGLGSLRRGDQDQAGELDELSKSGSRN